MQIPDGFSGFKVDPSAGMIQILLKLVGGGKDRFQDRSVHIKPLIKDWSTSVLPQKILPRCPRSQRVRTTQESRKDRQDHKDRHYQLSNHRNI